MSIRNPPQTPPKTGSGVYAVNTVCRLVKPAYVRLARPYEYPEFQDKTYTLQIGERVIIRDVEAMLTTGSISHLSYDNAGYRVSGTISLTKEVMENIPIYFVPHNILAGDRQGAPSPTYCEMNWIMFLKEPFEFKNHRYPGASAGGTAVLPKGTKVKIISDTARTLRGSIPHKLSEAYYTVSRIVPQTVAVPVANPANARITSDYLAPT